MKSSRLFILPIMVMLALAPVWGQNAPAPLAPHFHAGGRTPVIPIEIFDTILYVPVKVNGQGPFSFVLDTGNGGAPILNEKLARLLDIPLGQRQSIGGAGSKAADLYMIDGLDISMPGLDFAKAPSATLPLDLMDPHWGKGKDGLIGGSILSALITEIDYENKTLRLHAPDAYAGAGGEAVPIEIYGQPYVRVKIFLRGADQPLEALMMVDTGVRVTTFNSPFSKQNRLVEQSPKSLAVMTGFGIGGESWGTVGRVKAIQIGPFRFENPVVGFSTDTRGALASDQFSGIIGADLLRRFGVVFDYRGGKMTLKKNARFGDPFEFDMSGLRLTAEGDQFDRIKIFYVSDHTPAKAAGLLPGDEIEKIEGRAAADFGWEGLRRLFQQDGKELTLDINRAGRRFPVALKLRRLV